jgi:hypothetical protein
MAKPANVYKSHQEFLRVKLKGVQIVFHKRRCVTTDEKVIAVLDEITKTPNSLGIYVDENERTTSTLPPGTDWELRQQQIREFQAKQHENIDAGTYPQVPLHVTSSKDSPLTGGKSLPTSRFTHAEVASVLKAKMSGFAKVSTTDTSTVISTTEAAK